MNRIVAAMLLCLLAAPALAEGETARDLVKRMKDSDPSVRLSAVAEAEEVPDASITNQLVVLLADKDAVVRTAAIEALRVRPTAEERKKAAAGLAVRLKPLSAKLADEEEYLLAISALHDLAEPCAIKALLDIEPTEERDSALQRMMAVANIPRPEAVEALIAFLAKGVNRHTGQREYAARALRYATGKDFGGRDPDVWRSWWNDAKASFDFEAAAARRAEDQARKDEQARRKEEARAKREERERKRAEGGGREEGAGGDAPPTEKPPEERGPPDGEN